MSNDAGTEVPPSSDAGPSLWIDFIDEAHHADPGDELSFGRQADIVFDEVNTYLHRQAGDFVFADGSWWLRNQSRVADITVEAQQGPRSVVPAGATYRISHQQGTFRMQFGVSTYEAEWRIEAALGSPDIDLPEPQGGTTTSTFGAIRLNAEQRLMLAALCESRLVEPQRRNPPIAPNAEIAHRLGWTLRKFDRKLDYVCRRLADAGVPGVRGERGDEASDRRVHLVDHMMRTRAITQEDLTALTELG